MEPCLTLNSKIVYTKYCISLHFIHFPKVTNVPYFRMFQVRTPTPHSTIFTLPQLWEYREDLLWEVHWQHSNGKATLWHVQGVTGQKCDAKTRLVDACLYIARTWPNDEHSDISRFDWRLFVCVGTLFITIMWETNTWFNAKNRNVLLFLYERHFIKER